MIGSAVSVADGAIVGAVATGGGWIATGADAALCEGIVVEIAWPPTATKPTSATPTIAFAMKGEDATHADGATATGA